MGMRQHPKKENLVSEPSIMEDPSPKKLNNFGVTPGGVAATTATNAMIQSNWVDLVTRNAVQGGSSREAVRMNKVHHQMSGTSGGGVDGGEPHLTTNGEVSIASEFNYDALKYNEAVVAAPKVLQETPAHNNHFVYQSPCKQHQQQTTGIKRSLDQNSITALAPEIQHHIFPGGACSMHEAISCCDGGSSNNQRPKQQVQADADEFGLQISDIDASSSLQEEGEDDEDGGGDSNDWTDPDNLKKIVMRQK